MAESMEEQLRGTMEEIEETVVRPRVLNVFNPLAPPLIERELYEPVGFIMHRVKNIKMPKKLMDESTRFIVRIFQLARKIQVCQLIGHARMNTIKEEYLKEYNHPSFDVFIAESNLKQLLNFLEELIKWTGPKKSLQGQLQYRFNIQGLIFFAFISTIAIAMNEFRKKIVNLFKPKHNS